MISNHNFANLLYIPLQADRIKIRSVRKRQRKNFCGPIFLLREAQDDFSIFIFTSHKMFDRGYQEALVKLYNSLALEYRHMDQQVLEATSPSPGGHRLPQPLLMLPQQDDYGEFYRRIASLHQYL